VAKLIKLAKAANKKDIIGHSVNNSVSHLLPVLSGIPQDSILGHLQFFNKFYVNNTSCRNNQALFIVAISFQMTPNCLKIISSPQDSLKLQEYLNKLNFWSAHWHVLFGLPKIVLLSFKRKCFTSCNIGNF